MFWNSMSDWEKDHIAAAFSFELNMVVDEGVRNRVMNELLCNISPELADMVSGADRHRGRARRDARGTDAVGADAVGPAESEGRRS